MKLCFMHVRKPAVAGTFYPDDKIRLLDQLSHFLKPTREKIQQPKALIVPHAGYMYSGAIAGKAYSLLKPFAKKFRNIILLGPAHRYPLEGIATSDHSYFATPLGHIPIDDDYRNKVKRFPAVNCINQAHALEHSLEVQLPFLQSCLEDFVILPLLIGWTEPSVLKEVLRAFPDEESVLWIVSTDLSHFHTYEQAQNIDERTIQRVLSMESDIEPEEACGAHALDGFLQFCQFKNWQPELLASCNSGDISGDKSRVVGYASFSLH